MTWLTVMERPVDSQPQVITFTSFLPMVGGSLWVLRFLPPLKLVDLVDRYGISVSLMTTDMFHLSQALPGPFLIHDLTKAILLVLKDSDSQTYTLETNETISYHVCRLIIEIIVFAYKSSLKVVNDTTMTWLTVMEYLCHK
jgi:hypothetical protein